MSIVKIVIDSKRKKILRNGIQTECLEPLSFSLFANTHNIMPLVFNSSFSSLSLSLKIFITTITTKNGNYCFSFVCNAPVLDFDFGFLFFLRFFLLFLLHFHPIRIYIYFCWFHCKKKSFFFTISMENNKPLNLVGCRYCILLLFTDNFQVFPHIFFLSLLSSASNALQWRQKSEIYRCDSRGKMRFAVNLLTFSIQKLCVCARPR